MCDIHRRREGEKIYSYIIVSSNSNVYMMSMGKMHLAIANKFLLLQSLYISVFFSIPLWHTLKAQTKPINLWNWTTENTEWSKQTSKQTNDNNNNNDVVIKHSYTCFIDISYGKHIIWGKSHFLALSHIHLYSDKILFLFYSDWKWNSQQEGEWERKKLITCA